MIADLGDAREAALAINDSATRGPDTIVASRRVRNWASPQNGGPPVVGCNRERVDVASRSRAAENRSRDSPNDDRWHG